MNACTNIWYLFGFIVIVNVWGPRSFFFILLLLFASMAEMRYGGVQRVRNARSNSQEALHETWKSISSTTNLVEKHPASVCREKHISIEKGYLRNFTIFSFRTHFVWHSLVFGARREQNPEIRNKRFRCSVLTSSIDSWIMILWRVFYGHFSRRRAGILSRFVAAFAQFIK